MEEYAGRVLAERYRLPIPPPDAPEPLLVRALDTYSSQEVLVRQVPLPEVVEAELVDEYDAAGGPGGSARGYGGGGRRTGAGPGGAASQADRDPSDPVVRRALEAATAAARLPDHPRLDQVFDVFAQDGSLWIVSERIPARPLSALLADRTLTPHRAAEIAADVLTALRALHAHGWTHRNITPRTVLVCDDGRVVLTGLAAGAAEEALCGYDPVPREAAPRESDPPPPGAVRPGVVREWRAGGGGAASGGAGGSASGTGQGAGSGSGAAPGVARGRAEGAERGVGPGQGVGAVPGQGSGEGREPGPAQGSGGGQGPGALRKAGPRVSAAEGAGRGGVSRTVPGADGPPTGMGGAEGRGSSAPGAGSSGSAAGPAGSGAGQEPGRGSGTAYGAGPGAPGRGASGAGAGEDDPRRARAGAIAAYRAGATAARTAHDAHAAPRPDSGGTAPEGGRPHDRQPQHGQQPPQHGQQFQPYRDHIAPGTGPNAGPGQGYLANDRPGDDGTGSGRPAGLAGDPNGGVRPPANGRPAQGNRSALPSGQPAVPPGQHAVPPGSPGVPPGPPGVPPRRPGPQGQPQGRPDASQGRPDGPQGRPLAPQPGAQGLPPGPPGVPQPPYGAPRQGQGAPPVPRQPVQPGSATYGGGLPGPVRRPPGGTPALPAAGRAVPAPGPAGRAPARTGAGPVPAPRDAEPPAAVRPEPHTGTYSGAVPGNALAAERARQARIALVGPVTERWAPEQASPVHANWRLAPPVGPAVDLWALGALLYRSVQGHAPYAEDSAAELVQLVCSRAPAQAEECGALRPVVESLLRQDPADRPDFEELRGWLRSLVRTAPEPDAGRAVVTVPALGRSGDPRRLPVVRRRGELVRRGRHKKPRTGRERPRRPVPPVAGPAQVPPPRSAPPARSAPPPPPPDVFRDLGGFHDGDGSRDRGRGRGQEPRRERPPRGGPRRLGMLLLGLVLLLVAAAVVIAVVFLPESGADRGGAPEGTRSAAPSDAATGAPAPGPTQSQPQGTESGSNHSQTTAPAGLADGFEMRDDPEGFRVAVHKGWQRHGKNAQGQVRYTKGAFTLLVVPGRDTAKRFGSDPMAYQQDKEAELAPFREASWTSSSGVRRTDVGRTTMAEGTFTWGEDSASATYARNMALLSGGRYHLVLVIGPDRDRADVDRFYEQASTSFRP